LYQGQADREVVYSDDPVETAGRWVAEGAAYLHVVDLDGAFRGRPVHAGVIAAIAGAVDIPIQVGGGLRTTESVRLVLDCGVERAVVGTRAVAEPAAIAEMVQEFGSRLAVGIDARDGLVQVRGWVEATEVRAVELAADMDDMGVETIIYTDVSQDGTLGGASAGAVDDICAAVGCRVIASGGISSVEDVRALAQLGRPNLAGAIVGKALYEGKVGLRELLDEGQGR